MLRFAVLYYCCLEYNSWWHHLPAVQRPIKDRPVDVKSLGTWHPCRTGGWLCSQTHQSPDEFILSVNSLNSGFVKPGGHWHTAKELPWLQLQHFISQRWWKPVVLITLSADKQLINSYFLALETQIWGHCLSVMWNLMKWNLVKFKASHINLYFRPHLLPHCSKCGLKYIVLFILKWNC